MVNKTRQEPHPMEDEIRQRSNGNEFSVVTGVLVGCALLLPLVLGLIPLAQGAEEFTLMRMPPAQVDMPTFMLLTEDAMMYQTWLRKAHELSSARQFVDGEAPASF